MKTYTVNELKKFLTDEILNVPKYNLSSITLFCENDKQITISTNNIQTVSIEIYVNESGHIVLREKLVDIQHEVSKSYIYQESEIKIYNDRCFVLANRWCDTIVNVIGNVSFENLDTQLDKNYKLLTTEQKDYIRAWSEKSEQYVNLKIKFLDLLMETSNIINDKKNYGNYRISDLIQLLPAQIIIYESQLKKLEQEYKKNSNILSVEVLAIYNKIKIDIQNMLVKIKTIHENLQDISLK